MDISTEIVPKYSLGGVAIGEQIEVVVSRLSKGYTVIKTLRCTVINDGMLTIYYDEAGIISAMSCNSSFHGKYLNKLWPEITASELITNSRMQVAWAGYVKVDNLDGIGLLLPDAQDDFENLLDEFDVDHVFEELWIYGY